MNRSWILPPLLVLVALNLVLYLLMGRAKGRAAAAGQVDEARRALHSDAWPDKIQQINNNLRNQSELPVQFYVCVAILFALDAVGITALVCAWGFALTRLVHSAIHLGSNYVPHRRRVFTLGYAFVLILFGAAVHAAWQKLGGA